MSGFILPRLTLVLGGSNSGKSAYAENILTQTERPKRYIATAQAFDTEMQDKIDAHKAQRGPHWVTVEAPLDLSTALADAQRGEVVLLDCVTMWINNLMYHDHDITAAFATLNTALTTCAAPVVVVSNEVGLGGVSPDKLTRQFAKHQGRLNQRLGVLADRVIFVAAGLPMVLKG